MEPLTLQQLYDIVAQETHAAIGFGYVLSLYLFLPAYLWVGIAILLVVVFIKEWQIDPRIETDQPWLWAGVEDLLFYPVGMAPAVLLLFATHLLAL